MSTMMAEKKISRTLECALFEHPYRVIAYPEWNNADRLLVPTTVFLRERGSNQLLSTRERGTTTMSNIGAERSAQWEETQKEMYENVSIYTEGLAQNFQRKAGTILDEAMATYMEELDQSAASSSESETVRLGSNFTLSNESDISVDFREESKVWARLGGNVTAAQQRGEGVHQGKRTFHCNISNVRRVGVDSHWMRDVLKNVWRPDPEQFQLSDDFDIKAMQLWIVTEVLLAEEITITSETTVPVEGDFGTAINYSFGTPVLRYGKKGSSFPFAFRVVIASFNSMTGEFVQGSLRKSVFGTPPMKHLMAAEWDADEFEWDLDEETLIDQMVEFANAVKCDSFEVADMELDFPTQDTPTWLWLGVSTLTVISAYHSLQKISKIRKHLRVVVDSQTKIRNSRAREVKYPHPVAIMVQNNSIMDV